MWIKNAIWFFASKNVTTHRLFDQTLWYKNELFFSLLNDELLLNTLIRSY